MLALPVPVGMEPTLKTDVDALIVGGGPAGGTAALLLARAGWSVACIERKAFPRKKVCGEYLSATNGPLFESLGLTADFVAAAGPWVTHVGLFTGKHSVMAPLPQIQGTGLPFGRALSREKLDTLLLQHARQAGAEVRQPSWVETLHRIPEGFRCEIRDETTNTLSTIFAKIVLLAHGSWSRKYGVSPPNHPGDLLAFKAHFLGGGLPLGVMPLLAFPGGYGGMVHGDEGRFSVSCCVRRDMLHAFRLRYPGTTAGEAVQAHLEESLTGVKQVFRTARRDGAWLSAGPIRPGVRLAWAPGIYPLGNLAGEAHPVVAEGISMAMQSAWFLVQELQRRTKSPYEVGKNYAKRWRQVFEPRVRSAQAIAHWAMSPALLSASYPCLRMCPSLLSWGARVSGKVCRVLPRSPKGRL